MRDPTSQEIKDIATYLSGSYGDDDPIEMVRRSWIGVADHYISDGPGYTGRVITIIYPAGPEVHDVLGYDENGKLFRFVSEREIRTLPISKDVEDTEMKKLLDDLYERE